MERADSVESVRPGGTRRFSVPGLNRRARSVVIFVFLAFLLGILASVHIQAQVRDSTLSVRVTSPAGIPVPDARLVIKNTTTNEIRSLTVDRDGSCVVLDISTGAYEITASKQGFADAHTTVTIGA